MSVCADQTLTLTLFNMIIKFCSGAVSYYPIRKILLLLWKSLLTWLGGWEYLRVLKMEYREKAGLAPFNEDTLQVTKSMKSAPPPVIPVPGEASFDATKPLEPGAGDRSKAMVNNNVRPMAKRQLACSGTLERMVEGEMAEDGDVPGEGRDGDAEDNDAEMLSPEEETVDLGFVNPDSDENTDATDNADGMERPGSPMPSSEDSLTTADEKEPKKPETYKTLPWTPKIREQEFEQFLEKSRAKFFGYVLPSDSKTVAGFPAALELSIEALQKYMYTSLSELQLKREEKLSKYIFSQKEDEIPDTPAEAVYVLMLPLLPQYMIALLKILLAAAPSTRTRNDTINILVDLLPLESPNADDPDGDGQQSLEVAAQIALDSQRHKEVIVKAISGILLLLLKHFKLNHIYQFECVCQHLVFANCIPLILKFFDQNILQYVQSRNELHQLNFPANVMFWSSSRTWPLVSMDSVPVGAVSDEYCLWRNMFAAVNLLRILNKFTKWKTSRTMMLVVFKSASILRRALRVRHILVQLYALKLLKMQAKYLGRQWRKTNMEVMSAIYSKVRHRMWISCDHNEAKRSENSDRLNDDWAYGNETNAKPWDFQMEECTLRHKVEKFYVRRYENAETAVLGSLTMEGDQGSINPFSDPEFQPVDKDLLSVLGNPDIQVTERFRHNYESWLEREVFKAKINWDLLLSDNNACGKSG